jgi:hypothetical protein
MTTTTEDEFPRLMARWRDEYPGTTLGELHERDPEFVEALLKATYARHGGISSEDDVDEDDFLA